MDADHRIAEVERILGHAFINKLLCAEAIQMAAPRSALVVDGQVRHVQANKRLAVLGDAVATQVLCKAWYNDRDQSGNPPTREVWTKIRQETLSNGALAPLGNLLGLGVTIVTSPGHEGRPGTVMMATAMEALLGAVYEDGGDAAVRRVMGHIGLAQQVIRGVEAPGNPPERAWKGPRCEPVGIPITSSA